MSFVSHVKPESKTRNLRTSRRRRTQPGFGASPRTSGVARPNGAQRRRIGWSHRTIANASQHLQQLRRFGLVEASRDGKRVIYKLADTEVNVLVGALSRVTQRNVGAVEKVLNTYFRQRDNLEPVSRKELLRRMRDGLVTLIDTRPQEEFAVGHLPGAINLPLSELKRRLRELPRDQ